MSDILEAIVIGEVRNNGILYGYKIMSSSGDEMVVQTDKIVKALKQGKIRFKNLELVGDNAIRILQPKKEAVKVDNKQIKIKEEQKEIQVKVADKQIKVDNKNKKDTNDFKRMGFLIAELNKALKVYEQGKDEIMSNKEYDELYDELRELECKLDIQLSNSPTSNVGYNVVSELPKKKHKSVMLSLEKTKSLEDLESFCGNNDAILSWKLDGLTVVLTYNNGELSEAVTRGNGTIGELITNNANQFVNIPHRIPYKGELVIRGEAIIRYSDFEKINSTIPDDEKYKNPRNLCSGSVRQLNSGVTAKRHVNFFAFNIINCDEVGVKTILESYKMLLLNGFKVVEFSRVVAGDIKEVVESYTEKSKNLDIPVDGLVLTYNDIEYGVSLGKTAKTPKHSIAFKWSDETSITELIDVEWSASRTGLLNPVAIFKPVDIEGSTVSRASVHNVSIFNQLKLGYGDTIEVYKANMIIPQISKNIKSTGTCKIPRKCPVCGDETEVKVDKKSGVLTLYCMNPDCNAKGNRLMKHFVSRDAMNIDGISGATLEKLNEYGLIDTFASIYHLDEHEDEITSMEGFGVQSFNNMIESIDKSRVVNPENLIYALGIPNVGLQTSKIICNKFNNKLKDILSASYNELISIDGVGDVIAESFSTYFDDKTNAENFVELLDNLKVVEEVKKVTSEMKGITFCVTGKVEIFKNRDEVEKIIESMGGKLTGSVSKSTNYLVTNDTTSGSTKNKLAKEFGIPIITEREFIELFGINI